MGTESIGRENQKRKRLKRNVDGKSGNNCGTRKEKGRENKQSRSKKGDDVVELCKVYKKTAEKHI